MNTTRTQKFSFAYEKRILFSVCVVLLAFAVLYTYFVGVSIAYVVEREELVRESEKLVDTVASLERQYLTLSNQMTERVAYDAGFVPVERRIYVERGVLSLSNAR